jgi:hypothetical protein
MSCFAAALNVGPTTLMTSHYQLDGLESDLGSTAGLAKLLDRDDAALARALKGDRMLDSKLWLAIVLRADSETLFTTTDGRVRVCHVQLVRPGNDIALVAGSDSSGPLETLCLVPRSVHPPWSCRSLYAAKRNP